MAYVSEFSTDEVDENYLPSKIQKFFDGGCVFVTGCTGFLGKLLVEKLLRSCPDIGKIYVLIREKKGKSIEKRFSEDILESELFSSLKRSNSVYLDKIVPVSGDCLEPDLGLRDEDRQKLINEVGFIFHCAATVRFDETIRKATYINTRAIRDILVMAKEMKGLKALVHVSTAYSNCIRNDVEEKFYEPRINGDKLIQFVDLMNDDILKELTPTLLDKWPNTYVFTKAVAEDVVKTYGKNLPCTIVRPSIVLSTWKEPIAGWVDSIYGATGIMIGAALGLIRTLHCRKHCKADLIPADMVINCIIASAWEISQRRNLDINKEVSIEQTKNSETENEPDDAPIYNFTNCKQKPITWATYMKYTEHHLTQVPSPLCIWHYCLFLVPIRYVHLFLVLVLHFIPAYTIDFVLFAIGKEPQVVKGYKKIDKLLNVLSYFTTQEWDFSDKNTQELWKKLEPRDKKLFEFSFEAFDWNDYFHTYARGGRVYICKDPLDTVPQGRVRYLKLQIAHYALVSILFLIFLKTLHVLYNVLF